MMLQCVRYTRFGITASENVHLFSSAEDLTEIWNLRVDLGTKIKDIRVSVSMSIVNLINEISKKFLPDQDSNEMGIFVPSSKEFSQNFLNCKPINGSQKNL
jgi:hypothetical protein